MIIIHKKNGILLGGFGLILFISALLNEFIGQVWIIIGFVFIIIGYIVFISGMNEFDKFSQRNLIFGFLVIIIIGVVLLYIDTQYKLIYEATANYMDESTTRMLLRINFSLGWTVILSIFIFSIWNLINQYLKIMLFSILLIYFMSRILTTENDYSLGVLIVYLIMTLFGYWQVYITIENKEYETLGIDLSNNVIKIKRSVMKIFVTSLIGINSITPLQLSGTYHGGLIICGVNVFCIIFITIALLFSYNLSKIWDPYIDKSYKYSIGIFLGFPIFYFIFVIIYITYQSIINNLYSINIVISIIFGILTIYFFLNLFELTGKDRFNNIS